MELDGLQRMLDFLDTLEDEGVHFVIDQVDPGSLLVSFTLVGTRVEVISIPTAWNIAFSKAAKTCTTIRVYWINSP